MSFGSRVRKLDMFKKTPKDLSTGTNIGGLISIFTTFLIGFFIYMEVTKYFYPKYKATIVQDNYFTRKQMRIFVDITFPRLPCEIISLDLQDVMMSHHPNIGSIKKFRLNADGHRIQSGDFELLRQPNINKQYDTARVAMQNNYGCRLTGSFTVKEVPGNFHISSHAYQNIFMRLQMDGALRNLNVSHIIHDLHFGEYGDISFIQQNHPETVMNKLANTQKMYTNQQANYNSHYHIDIVPTTYLDSYFSQTEGFQYTYNHNQFIVNHMPVVYFNYHIGGLSVLIIPETSSLLGFLIVLCSIIGGTYTLANFLDTILHRLFGTKHSYTLIQ